MNALISFFSQHPFIATAITTWWANWGASIFVSSLPAPRANSTQLYIFAFKFCNAAIVGNLARAKNTAVESSPNFIPAVAKLAELPK